MARPRVILAIAAVVGLAAAGGLAYGAYTKIRLPVTVTTTPGFYTVSEVSDGDTFSVNMDGRIEKIRMIGVDTPETVRPNSPVECYGKAASDFTKSRLGGQQVRLEADPINQNRDRYDRLLRYVYLADGTLYNKLLISEGYGFAYLSFPFTKAEEFREAQKLAREQNKGLWGSDCQINESDTNRPKTNQL